MEDRINELKGKFPSMANFLTILPKLMGLQLALFRDPRVPRWLKLVTAGSVAYVALPFDFLPDFAPLVGKGDDIVVILLVLVQYMKFCPPDVLREHWLEHMGDDYDMEQTLRRAMDEIEPVVEQRYASIKATIEGVLARFGRGPQQPAQQLASPDGGNDS
jgi:uncharacterized membrane protein YkvA (DUF1232 family)